MKKYFIEKREDRYFYGCLDLEKEILTYANLENYTEDESGIEFNFVYYDYEQEKIVEETKKFKDNNEILEFFINYNEPRKDIVDSDVSKDMMLAGSCSDEIDKDWTFEECFNFYETEDSKKSPFDSVLAYKEV